MPTITSYWNFPEVPVTEVEQQAPETCACPACESLRCLSRTRFYTGQLLTERDLNDEQEYLLAKNRLHNRYLHGTGIVCGLEVVCDDCRGWVKVKPGYALDPCGNDVVVCNETPFNVIDAIKQCRDANAKATRTDCEPLMATGDRVCEDAEETWCVTLEYKESPTRVVNALARQTAGSCGCGNGNGNGKSCGCGNGTATSTATATASSATGAAAQPIGCEPSRIAEGFQLGVVEKPRKRTIPSGIGSSTHEVYDYNVVADKLGEGAASGLATRAAPGTYVYEYLLCERELRQVANATPAKRLGATTAGMYTATCDYVQQVREVVASRDTFGCEVVEMLGAIVVPRPDNVADEADYRDRLETLAKEVQTVVLRLAQECRCLAFMPPCPPAATDDRLVLACVTVKGDRILRICHGEGRQQLLTFPVLEYWMTGMPAGSRLLALLMVMSKTDRAAMLESMCCAAGVREPIDDTASSPNWKAQNLRDAYTGAMYGFSHMMSADVLAADPARGDEVAAVEPLALVGRSLSSAKGELRDAKVKTVVTKVDDWPPQAVALATAATPGSVPAGSTVTLYQLGEKIVGVDAATPEPDVNKELASLRAKVAKLEKER